MSDVLAIVGALSIDSVLTQDGRYLVGKVGGNAVWSSLGATISGNAPRILSMVGANYPAHVLETLSSVGIDTSAVVQLEREHPVRVTFAHLPDGGRIQPVPAEMIAGLPAEAQAEFVDTTKTPEILRLGSPEGHDIPEEWLDEVDFWHLPLLPLVRHRSVVERLAHARGKLHTDCPARSDLIGDPFRRLAPTLPSITVFLPSTSDFDVIAPDQSTSDSVAELQAAGSRALIVKAGGSGSFVIDGDSIWHVPAFSDLPVDPTGAGDTFCGGFLVGMAATGDLVEAAALGAAAASFALATENPLTLIDVDPDLTLARARSILGRATRLTESIDDYERATLPC